MTRGQSRQDPRQRATRLLAILALIVSVATGVIRWQNAGATAGEDVGVICVSEGMLDASGNPYDHPALTRAGVSSYLVLAFPPMLVQAWAPVAGFPAARN